MFNQSGPKERCSSDLTVEGPCGSPFMLNTRKILLSCTWPVFVTAAVLLALRVFFPYMPQETHYEVYELDTDGSGLYRLVSCSNIQNIPDVL